MSSQTKVQILSILILGGSGTFRENVLPHFREIFRENEGENFRENRDSRFLLETQLGTGRQ